MLAYAKLAVVVGEVTKESSIIESVQHITCTHSRLTVYTTGEGHGVCEDMRYGAGAQEIIFYYVSCLIYIVYELLMLLIIVYNTRPP